jgi:hypothetical protein
MIKKSNIDVALFVGALVLVKLALDALYAMHGNTNNVFDILDYKDWAKQYLYAPGYAEKRHLFLITAGGVRSPLESVLIAVGAAVLGLGRIDLATYLVALASLGVLCWAVLAVKAEAWTALRRPARGDSDALLLALLLFAPLTVGLSRSSLVELPLTACIYAVYALCLAYVRQPRLAYVVGLNLFLCAGMMWKATFPIYVVLPFLGTLYFALRRRGFWKLMLASALFQLLAQRAYGYLLVNRRAILDNLLSSAGGLSVRYQDGLVHNLVVRALGLPLVLVLAIFVVALVMRAGRRTRLDDDLAPLQADDIERDSEPRWSPARVVLALGVADVLLEVFLYVSAQNQYLRFFYVAVPAAFLGAAYLYERLFAPRFWWLAAAPAALAGIVITAFYSVSPQPGLCDRGWYRLALAQSCGGVEPVDGSAYSPIGGPLPAPAALAALKAAKVRAGGSILLVGSNPYNNGQVFTYELRDQARRDGWQASFKDIDRAVMAAPSAYPTEADAAVLIEPSNRVFSRVEGNGFAQPVWDAAHLAEVRRGAEARLEALGLVRVARLPNPAGDMEVYAKPQ